VTFQARAGIIADGKIRRGGGARQSKNQKKGDKKGYHHLFSSSNSSGSRLFLFRPRSEAGNTPQSFFSQILDMMLPELTAKIKRNFGIVLSQFTEG